MRSAWPDSTAGTRLGSISRDYPATTFFALTLFISWGLWLPILATPSAVTELHILPGGFGPALAAIVLTRLHGTSVRGWLREGLDWRVGRRWYAIALGLPVAAGCVMGTIFVAARGDFAATQVARMAPMYPVMLLFMILVGGGQEEFGWRGFALPVLQERFDALTASIIIGIVWAVWHAPLFVFDAPGYSNQSFLLYWVLVVGFSIIFTWLYNSTGGNILLSMVLHGGINAASGLGGSFVQNPTALDVPILAAYAIPIWTLAGVLVLRYGRETLSILPALTEHADEVGESEQSTSPPRKTIENETERSTNG